MRLSFFLFHVRKSGYTVTYSVFVGFPYTAHTVPGGCMPCLNKEVVFPLFSLSLLLRAFTGVWHESGDRCLMFLTLFAALLPVLQIETHHWLWSCYLVTIFECGMAVRYLKLYRATVSWRLLFCAKGSFDLVAISARKHIWHYYYYYHAFISNFTLLY